MRRFLWRTAPVFVFIIILAGCRSATAPDVSFARMSPPPAKDFDLIDPGYAVYDLSRLRVGMTKAEVHRLFSQPLSVKFTPRDEYWEYEWFELYFRDGRLNNWFDLPADRQIFMPSSRSSRAGR